MKVKGQVIWCSRLAVCVLLMETERFQGKAGTGSKCWQPQTGKHPEHHRPELQKPIHVLHTGEELLMLSLESFKCEPVCALKVEGKELREGGGKKRRV